MPRGEQGRLDLTSFLEIVVRWVVASGMRGSNEAVPPLPASGTTHPAWLQLLASGGSQDLCRWWTLASGLFYVPQPCLRVHETPASP